MKLLKTTLVLTLSAILMVSSVFADSKDKKEDPYKSEINMPPKDDGVSC